MIQCESCGMPMKKLSEFAKLNLKSKYCTYCTNEKGNLKPFEQKREEMINFHMQENKVTRKEAEKLIDKLMKRMSAWGKYYDH